MADVRGVIYNKEEYQQLLLIQRIDIKNSAVTSEKDSYALINDQIVKIDLINDLIDIMPMLIFEYKDINSNAITRFHADGYTLVDFYLVHYTDDQKSIRHSFIIDDIEIIDRTTSDTTYRVICKSFLSTKFNSYVDYSTTDTAKPTLDIVKDLFKKIGLDLYISKETTLSDKKITFLTREASKVFENINLVLKFSASDKTGLYYIVWNLIDDRPEVISVNSLFENTSFEKKNSINKFNDLNLPSTLGISLPFLTINDVSLHNYIYGSNSYNLAGTTTYNIFDYGLRKWTKEEYTFDKMKKALPKISGIDTTNFDKIYKKVPEMLTQEGLSYDIDISNLNYNVNVFNGLNLLNNYNEVVQFNTYGYIERNIGQIINVTAFDSISSQRFGGKWMIGRILHKFTKGNYVNEVSIVRTNEYKNTFID